MEQSLNEHLKRLFGFSTFKGNQKAIIESLMSGKDTLVLMPTGGGKSLCYQLPAMIMDGTAIIISPLIALMKNQVDSIRGVSEEEGVAHFLNSQLCRASVNQVREDVRSGKTKMLFVAPETLSKEENTQFLKGIKISFYAVDEAHCISEWGHDFRPEYRRIRPMVDAVGRAPIIALTATAPPKVQHDILKNLGIQNAEVFKSSFNRPNLYYEIRPKNNAAKDIIQILKHNPGKSAIVYCLSRKTAEELTEQLCINGIRALTYHAGLDAQTRAENQDKFLMQEVDVVCATVAFGMGIDKPDVRFVFHYDIPKSLEGYYQETGRAGRDGGEGRCITYYCRRDIQKLEKFMQGKPLAEQEIGRQLIAETVSYAESSECRRKTLLAYFGEEYTGENCGNCDNCLNPKERFNAREAVCLLLDVVEEFNNRMKVEYLTDFLLGVATDQIRSLGHQKHYLFGKGDNHDRRYWTSIIRQSIVEGYISKDIENYGILFLGPKHSEPRKSKNPIMMCLDRDFNETDDDCLGTEASGTSALDEPLLDILKGLRKEAAQKLKLAPHILFSDHALEVMATYYPTTIEELTAIPGIGEGKAQKFGQDFVKTISKYVEDNEIERPQDTIIKARPSKSKNKIDIINGVDKRIPLDILAQSKGMSMEELMNEMETIVISGTYLDINYYLRDKYDDVLVDDVFIYFKEHKDYDVTLALQEFSNEDDYPEEMIRLVKIKFISEIGNKQ
ncbi:MAG: ATP-dependent DNA helicase RecQ [Bacteroidales bacterium]|nr:ATP-dependent DNA helicase RecQ [Bacteroidales bacterium]